MKAPRFWDQGGILPCCFRRSPRCATDATARRLARPGWRAPVPVICCGNASVGGTGKTTLALDLGARLIARGRRPAFLTRGYGGGGGGARQVAVQDDAAEMGDEPLLLAALAPTFAGADRAATARLAVAAGADVLILDDGLQNPTLAKDAALLVIDGEMGFGNSRVIPAGPLREPVANAAARCRAAVLIGPDRRDALTALPAGLPVLRASLRATEEAAEFAGKPVLAFAGIGRPDKFFATLAEAGAVIVARHAFADHHRYTAAELARLHAQAEAAGAIPVTTPKDAVRLPPAERAESAASGWRWTGRTKPPWRHCSTPCYAPPDDAP